MRTAGMCRLHVHLGMAFTSGLSLKKQHHFLPGGSFRFLFSRLPHSLATARKRRRTIFRTTRTHG